ncbi:MAG: hypothetical protein WAO71_15280 [Gallionella sp.]
MSITLRLSSDKIGDEDLQVMTRELCDTLNAETNIAASLPTQPVANAKGTLVELGVLALGFVGSDTGKVLLSFIEKLLFRESNVELEVTHPDGRVFKINAKNKSSKEVKELIDQLQ